MVRANSSQTAQEVLYREIHGLADGCCWSQHMIIEVALCRCRVDSSHSSHCSLIAAILVCCYLWHGS